MKKALSLVLSFVLAFSCFAGVLTTTTATAECVSPELIINGDFEDTAKQPEGVNVSGVSGATVPANFLS